MAAPAPAIERTAFGAVHAGAKIGHINKYWGRDRGGVEAVLQAMVEDLCQRGYRVSVLACRPWGSASRGFPTGVVATELRSPVVARMPVHPGFPRALAKLAAGCDLLHFHLPFPLAEAAALGVAKRTPWVATMHAEVVGHASWMRWCQRAVTTRFLERMDAIVVSAPTTSQAQRLLRYEERVRVIPFGFDLEPYYQANIRRSRGRMPVIAFVGRLVAYKGVDVLLRALVGLNARLEIVGDGPERKRLEELVNQLGLRGRVKFCGHVADAELPGRLQGADIFVLPSRTQAETFGVAQVEAMAAGLPVVNTALATGTDWVSVHGLTGLTVAPGDVEGLSEALRRLLDDRELRLACGRRGRRRAQELFSVGRRGAQLAALYDELLA